MCLSRFEDGLLFKKTIRNLTRKTTTFCFWASWGHLHGGLITRIESTKVESRDKQLKIVGSIHGSCQCFCSGLVARSMTVPFSVKGGKGDTHSACSLQRITCWAAVRKGLLSCPTRGAYLIVFWKALLFGRLGNASLNGRLSARQLGKALTPILWHCNRHSHPCPMERGEV